MLFYLLLIAVSPFLIIAFPQNLDDSYVSRQRIMSTKSVPFTAQCNDEDDEISNKILDCLKKITPFTLEPVCGTNGLTYINIEELKCWSKLEDLTFDYDGPCEDE